MPRLTTLFAIVVGPGNDEGVLRRRTEFGTQPMVADSIERLRQFFPIADEVATRTGWSVARFVRAGNIDPSKVALTIGAPDEQPRDPMPPKNDGAANGETT